MGGVFISPLFAKQREGEVQLGGRIDDERPIQGGCTKDTDCKGDRICVDGECTNPERGCSTDMDCPGDKICLDKRCVSPQSSPAAAARPLNITVQNEGRSEAAFLYESEKKSPLLAFATNFPLTIPGMASVYAENYAHFGAMLLTTPALVLPLAGADENVAVIGVIAGLTAAWVTGVVIGISDVSDYNTRLRMRLGLQEGDWEAEEAKKSAWFAFMASLYVPGTGQFYAGENTSGAAYLGALVLNFALANVTSDDFFDNPKPFFFVTHGIIALASAIHAAVQVNRYNEAPFVEDQYDEDRYEYESRRQPRRRRNRSSANPWIPTPTLSRQCISGHDNCASFLGTRWSF